MRAEVGGILTPATSEPEVHIVDSAKRRMAIYIVLACTLLVAIGQYLIKLGANQLTHAGLVGTAIGILTIPQLFAGYCLYAVFTVMFVYALRHGELSVLYPLISLGYVWVTITAVIAFHETMNPLKVIGLAVIIGGVATATMAAVALLVIRVLRSKRVREALTARDEPTSTPGA